MRISALAEGHASVDVLCPTRAASSAPAATARVDRQSFPSDWPVEAALGHLASDCPPSSCPPLLLVAWEDMNAVALTCVFVLEKVAGLAEMAGPMCVTD